MIYKPPPSVAGTTPSSPLGVIDQYRATQTARSAHVMAMRAWADRLPKREMLAKTITTLQDHYCTGCPLLAACYLNAHPHEGYWCTTCNAYYASNLDYQVRCDGFQSYGPRLPWKSITVGPGTPSISIGGKMRCPQCEHTIIRKPIIEGFLLKEDVDGTFKVLRGVSTLSGCDDVPGG